MAAGQGRTKSRKDERWEHPIFEDHATDDAKGHRSVTTTATPIPWARPLPYAHPMGLWEFALWGLGGAACVDALQFVRAITRTRDWPWRHKESPGPGPLAVSVVLRAVVGTLLATALAAGGQLAGPLGAFVAGVTAPLVIERLLTQVDVLGGPPEEPPQIKPGGADAP